MPLHSRARHSAIIHPVICGRLSLPSPRADSISVWLPTCISRDVTPLAASVICEIPVSPDGFSPYGSHVGARSARRPMKARPQCLTHVRTIGDISSSALRVMEITHSAHSLRTERQYY